MKKILNEHSFEVEVTLQAFSALRMKYPVRSEERKNIEKIEIRVIEALSKINF